MKLKITILQILSNNLIVLLLYVNCVILSFGQILKERISVSVSSRVENLRNLVRKICSDFFRNAKGKFYAFFKIWATAFFEN